MRTEIDRQARREAIVRTHHLRTKGRVFPPDGGQDFPDRFATRHDFFIPLGIGPQRRGNVNRYNGNV